MTRKTTTQSQRRAHILDFGYCYPLSPRVVHRAVCFISGIGCFPLFFSLKNSGINESTLHHSLQACFSAPTAAGCYLTNSSV